MSDNVYSAEIVYRVTLVKRGVEPQGIRAFVNSLLYPFVCIGKTPVGVLVNIGIVYRGYYVNAAVF